MGAHKSKGYGVVILTNSNHPEFIEELSRAVALTYGWSNFVPTYKKQLMDTTKFAALRGRYRNGSDGVLALETKGARLFKKYIRGETTELFQITDSTYVGVDSDQIVQVKTNPADGKRYVLLPDRSGAAKFEHPLLESGDKIPYEYLMEGNFEKALAGYRALLRADPKDQAISEENINGWGYQLLEKEKIQLAKDVFKINTLLYPNSANTYYSYAEACLKNGDKELAIKNFKKSLALNPANKGAERKLEELKK
jgi:tetratricopeptide (TPR) repeat protein